MKQEMTSAQRVRAVIAGEDFDHIPLTFESLFHSVIRFLYDRMPDELQRCDYYLALGLDAAVKIPLDPLDYDCLQTTDSLERITGEQYPVMHREYATSAGTLRQSVRKTPDYGCSVYGPDTGDVHIRLFTDHNVPASRSVEYLISRPEQLPALEQILKPIAGAKRDDFLRRASRLKKQCRQRGVMMAGYSWGVGDPLIWLSGVENVLLWSLDQPDFLRDYAAIVARWNLENLKLLAEAGCEYVVRRGWYESADFWSPDLYEKFLLPHLRRETDFARSCDMLYAYCMNSGIDPLLEGLSRSGIDVLCNIDPMAAMTTPELIKKTIGDRITLCGGVNNQHVIAKGTAADVDEAVQQSISQMGEGGRYMLAPGDSLLENTQTTEDNFRAMISTWQRLCVDATA